MPLFLKSRTFWTLVVTFVINGIAPIHNAIPGAWATVIDAGLLMLATYFHVNPSANYSA